MIQSIVGQGDVPDDILTKYMNAVSIAKCSLIIEYFNWKKYPVTNEFCWSVYLLHHQWKEFPSELIADAKLKCVFEMQKENEEPNYNKALKSDRASPPKQKSEEKVGVSFPWALCTFIVFQISNQ